MKLIFQVCSVAALLLVVYVGFAWYEGRNGIYSSEVSTFLCPNDATFTMRYDATGNRGKINLGKEEYTLTREIAGSGARYTNANNGLLFWEHQGDAKLRLPGRAQEMTCQRQ